MSQIKVTNIHGVFTLGKAPTSRFPGSTGMPHVGGIYTATPGGSHSEAGHIISNKSSRLKYEWSTWQPLKGKEIRIKQCFDNNAGSARALKHPVTQQKFYSTQRAGAEEEPELVPPFGMMRGKHKPSQGAVQTGN